MHPYSRGSPPIEYTLRIAFDHAPQFSFGETSAPHLFQLRGVRCSTASENGSLLLKATGFPSLEEAKTFFHALQGYLAHVCIEKRVAVSIPKMLAEPIKSNISFMDGDEDCTTHGWPPERISPWLIPKYGASVYPEHEYVAIEDIYKINPLFTQSVIGISDALSSAAEICLTAGPPEALLLDAIDGYAHACRSTQLVWSFLLTVSILEMLATVSRVGPETISAVKDLFKIAKCSYGKTTSVDLKRILECLMHAKKISITSAVKALVKKHCAPGVAVCPLEWVFVDEDDCDCKVAAIYDVRSKYVHEGRIARPKKYTFDELHEIARASLGHILQRLLDAHRVAARTG